MSIPVNIVFNIAYNTTNVSGKTLAETIYKVRVEQMNIIYHHKASLLFKAAFTCQR